METEEPMKACCKCGMAKLLRDFPARRSASKAGGWRPLKSSHCRACRNRAVAAWRALPANANYHRVKSAQWREKQHRRRAGQTV